MKALTVLIMCFLPVLLKAQEESIKWSDALSWRSVIDKAKAENKYIFVDCFATWCQPCHAMDKDVFSKSEIIKAINEKFIAVKMQIDKTDYDNDFVKSWYIDAKIISSNYAVTAFPTFLFFSPDGKPLHRAVGYRTPEKFSSLIEDAFDPGKQYYALLDNYKPGKLDTSELKGLALALKNSGGDLGILMAIEYLNTIPKSQLSNKDNIDLMCEFSQSSKMQEFAKKFLSSIPPQNFVVEPNRQLITYFAFLPEVRSLVLKYLSGLSTKALAKNLSLLLISSFNEDSKAKKIVNKYITRLPFKDVFEKQNLTVLYNYTNSSTDKGFPFFYNYGKKIDSFFGKDFSVGKIMSIIIQEEYDSAYGRTCKASLTNVKNDSLPWQFIKEKVEKKYGKYYADRCDIHVKASLYEYLAKNHDQHWDEYINNYILEKEKYGWDTTGPTHLFIETRFINNFVFDAIFYHSTDRNQISTGLKWMEGVVRRNPKEANNIDTYANLLYKSGRHSEAIKWQEKAVQTAIDEKQDWLLPSLKSNLSKMQKGIPTWIKEKK